MNQYTIKEAIDHGKVYVKINTQEEWSRFKELITPLGGKVTTAFYGPNYYSFKGTYNASPHENPGYTFITFNQLIIPNQLDTVDIF